MRTLAVAALAAFLPAQNLLDVRAWKNTDPKVQTVQVHSEGVSFGPACSTGGHACAVMREGIVQTVNVPADGAYILSMAGSAGSSGGHYIEATVGGTPIQTKEPAFGSRFARAHVVWIKKGPQEVRILASADFVTPHTWATIELRPAISPTVQVELTDLDQPGLERGFLLTDANILALSIGAPPYPIVLPGMTHGLNLDPSSMVIVGTSVFGRIWVSPPKYLPKLPRIYYQAATWQGFGSRGWF